MIRRQISSLFAACAVVGLLCVPACQQESKSGLAPKASSSTGPLKVHVSVAPLGYLAKRIGRDDIKVSVLLPPGQSPGTYDPTPKSLVELEKGDIFFRVGTPFEKRVVSKIEKTMPNLQVVDLRDGISLRKLEAHSHDDGTENAEHKHGHDCAGHHHDNSNADAVTEKETHTHSATCAHEADEMDPHVWMSPRLAKTMATTICSKLSELDAAKRASFEANLKELLSDLDETNEKIKELIAPLAGREFFVFHPAYGYFADEYGLKQIAVESSGKQPTAKELQSLIDLAKEKNVKILFVQPQFDQSNAETIARAIGGVVLPLDPLSSDYLSNLLSIAKGMENAISVKDDPASVAKP